MKPVLVFEDTRGKKPRQMLLFANGQIRRVPGEGHSTPERAIRRFMRNQDYASRRLYKRERKKEALTNS